MIGRTRRSAVISAVLPLLGEVDVEQRTLDNLLDEHRDAVDPPAAAAVKHDSDAESSRGRWINGREPAAPRSSPTDRPWRVADALRRWSRGPRRRLP